MAAPFCLGLGFPGFWARRGLGLDGREGMENLGFRERRGLGFGARKAGDRNAIPFRSRARLLGRRKKKKKPWFQIFVVAFQIEGTRGLYVRGKHH